MKFDTQQQILNSMTVMHMIKY